MSVYEQRLLDENVVMDAERSWGNRKSEFGCSVDTDTFLRLIELARQAIKERRHA